MSAPLDPYAQARLEQQGVPTTTAVLVLAVAIVVAVFARASGVGEVDSVETFGPREP